MTDKTNRTNQKAHGGYRTLKSYQTTTLIYDLTVEFCRTYLSDRSNPSYRLIDQMIQAARSGRQNIAEGSEASSVSKKSEIKLVGVARASLEELLIQLESLKKAFKSVSSQALLIEEGGFTENLFKARLKRRESDL